MDKKAVMAIIVAVVIAIAAATVVVMDKNNGDERGANTYAYSDLELLSADVNPVLEVYGNVNNDLVIDQKDVGALKAALANGTASRLKYADANFDDAVDEKDVAYIESIINATYENPVEVRHLNRYTGGDYYTESKVPIDSFATSASANMIQMYELLGIKDKIKAVAYYGKIDDVLYPDYQYLFSDTGKIAGDGTLTGTLKYRVGGSAGYFAKELLLNHVNNDGVSAVFTADNSAAYLSGPSKSYSYGITEKDVRGLGLGVIRVAAASTDPGSYVSDLAMIAFATGTDSSKCASLATWYSDAIRDVNEKLKDVDNYCGIAVSSSASYSKSADGTVKTSNYVSSHNSDYTRAVLSAGGVFVMGSYDFGTSSSSAKMTDLGKWLVDYPVDKIIVIKTGSGFSWYGNTVLTEGLETVQSCALAFSETSAYYEKNVYVICGDMPVVLRTIYAASVLYPNEFSKEWADDYNVSFSTQFLGLSKDVVERGIYAVSMSDMGLPRALNTGGEKPLPALLNSDG